MEPMVSAEFFSNISDFLGRLGILEIPWGIRHFINICSFLLALVTQDGALAEREDSNNGVCQGAPCCSWFSGSDLCCI